jgi:hypothetical protein
LCSNGKTCFVCRCGFTATVICRHGVLVNGVACYAADCVACISDSSAIV